jgi:hypothetical protein
MLRHVVLVSILLAVACLAADSDSREDSGAVSFDDLNLQPVTSPAEEPVECTLNRRFSPNNALERLDSMSSALSDFRELTTLAKPILPDEKLAEVGNLDWDTQNLGFTNWLGAVRGTLHKQRYMIAKLQYDLALERLADKKINAEQAEKARQEYEQAKKAFREFWNSFCIAD